MTFVKGQWFARADGSGVRIDYVENGTVYFVSWKPSQEYGNPIRMPVHEFETAIRREQMVES